MEYGENGSVNIKYDEFMGPGTATYDDADFVIVPIPYEQGASWIGGTSKGPAAVLRASQEVEYYDLELGFSMGDIKYCTIAPVQFGEIRPKIEQIMNDGKIPISIGGDHSISIPILTMLPKDVSILHMDAHLDMRAEYRGNPNSHASALYGASKNHKVVHTGIRSGCEEDIENVKSFGNIIVSPHDIGAILDGLSDDVYITFDVDVLDPSIMPATGTPEQGGINWLEANSILRSVCADKNVIGMDFVELSPREGLHACDAAVAKLIMRSMIYSSL